MLSVRLLFPAQRDHLPFDAIFLSNETMVPRFQPNLLSRTGRRRARLIGQAIVLGPVLEPHTEAFHGMIARPQGLSDGGVGPLNGMAL